MTAPAVDVQALTHRYGSQLALDGVTLALPRAASIAFIGPDGVGKSTLLSIIAGVRRIQGGNVHVLGLDMGNGAARHALSSRIAFMPQGLGQGLYPTLSVQENLDFFARLYALPAAARRRTEERLLRATALAPFADRPAGKLSGGMKQKLGLCCALVHAPDLLILDEPTTGVDPLSRRQFWALVDALRAARPHMTVLVSTAYMDEAQRFEHLVAMDAGRVLATGSPQELKARTGSNTLEDAYTALLPAEKRPAGGPLRIAPWQNTGAAPVIEAEHLTRRFGRFVAVDDVSFRIQRGEIFGFLGSNGCGKSTTMKMLTGLLDISSGSAKLLGAPIHAGDMATRQATCGCTRGSTGWMRRAPHAPWNRLWMPLSCARTPPPCPPACRWAYASACSWRLPACTARKSSSWTSQPRAWIRQRATCSGATWRACRARRA